MEEQNEKIKMKNAMYMEMSPLMIEFLNKLLLLSRQQTVYDIGIKEVQQNVSIVDTMQVSFDGGIDAKKLAQLVENAYQGIMSVIERITKRLILARSILQLPDSTLNFTPVQNQKK
eukprot:536813_1